jgi:ABC-type amino acid transport substrate-binding protein
MSPTTRSLAALPLALLLAACTPPHVPAAAPDTRTPTRTPTDHGDSWQQVRAAGSGEITVLYVPAPGWAYRDAEGRLTGVTVELMRLFATHVEREHGTPLRVRFVEEPQWRTFYARVRDGSGGVFGIGNVTITPARRQEIRFSPPYLANVATLITHRDVPELRRLPDLPIAFRGLVALAFQGTLHEERLRELQREHFPGMHIVHAASNPEILERVAAGGFFAYVDAYNLHAARAAGAPLRAHPVADDADEAFGVIMPLDSDWEPVIGSFFTARGGLHARTEYHALLATHLGEELARTLVDALAAPES